MAFSIQNVLRQISSDLLKEYFDYKAMDEFHGVWRLPNPSTPRPSPNVCSKSTILFRNPFWLISSEFIPYRPNVDGTRY